MPSIKCENTNEIQRKIEQKWDEIDKELRLEMATANMSLESAPVLRFLLNLPNY